MPSCHYAEMSCLKLSFGALDPDSAPSLSSLLPKLPLQDLVSSACRGKRRTRPCEGTLRLPKRVLTVHLWGFSPVCLLMCTTNMYWALKGFCSLEQSSQRHTNSFFSPWMWSLLICWGWEKEKENQNVLVTSQRNKRKWKCVQLLSLEDTRTASWHHSLKGI